MNEMLLLVTSFLCVGLVFISWKLGKEYLYCSIIIFLALIATVGGKIAVFFGHETNTGNIFYASIFLATYFIIERYGRYEGFQSIWLGVGGAMFFLTLALVTVEMTGVRATAPFNSAISVTFGASLRVALASLTAYTLSQILNVYIYVYLKREMNRKYLWLRANITNALAQLLDSVIFFIVAFWTVVPSMNVIEIIAMSLFLKISFMMIASFLLYFNTVEAERGEYSQITVR